MTEEEGICRVTIHPTAINVKDFVAYLHKLRLKFKKTPLAIFMDNLQVHRAKEVKPCWEKLDIVPVWNVAYSPEFNPIGNSLTHFYFNLSLFFRGCLLKGEA